MAKLGVFFLDVSSKVGKGNEIYNFKVKSWIVAGKETKYCFVTRSTMFEYGTL